MNIRIFLYSLFMVFSSSVVLADDGVTSDEVNSDEIPIEELERWLEDDKFEPPRYKEVNEGQLVFLAKPPKKRIHHHHNTLTILPDSLDNGWIKMEQCHRNIDRVEVAQVVFRRNQIKGLKITKATHIEKAWVENDTVQLENITDNAILCIEARTRSLHVNKDGSYSLKNGPFMRKFLDGYYPLRVSMDLHYPGTSLKLVNYTPGSQTGFSVITNPGSVRFDALFEGRLQTEFTFQPLTL